MKVIPDLIPRTIQVALIFLIFVFTTRSSASYFSESYLINRPDTTTKSGEVLQKINEITSIYGSLRFKVGYTFPAETGIKDDASRMGIKGVIPVIKGIDAIMQPEVGVGLVGIF